MTQPVQDNPFGVHVPRSRSVVPWMAPPLMDDHPLVPWEEEGHARQWVDVDHAEEQVRAFRSCLDQQLPQMLMPEVDRGHVVVVTGPVGMGKTTLIHRCIHLTRERLRELELAARTSELPPGAIRPPRPVVVMTGGYDNHAGTISVDERGQFATTDGINTAIRNKIVNELNLQFGEAKLRVPGDGDVGETFAGTSRLLAEQDAMLLVLVPHMDWRDDMGSVRTEFLKSCLRHARSRIVLFVEVRHQDPRTAHSEVIKVLGRQPALTHLSLGSLTPEDTVKFSQAVRAGHPDPDSQEPPASDAPRDPDAWSRSDVRQLRKMCFTLAEQQRTTHGRVRVTAADLPSPTPDLASMLRRPASPAGVPQQPPPSPDS